MELYELYKSYKRSRRGKRRSADQVQFELDSITRKGIVKDYAGCKVKAADRKRKRKKCSTNKQ